DTYGHAAGDVALKEFSRRLQRAVRACDLPVRIGGDEFLVILPDCPPEQVPPILARMDSLAFTFEGKRIPILFSHGMAQYQVSDTPESLVARADERLYAAKDKSPKAVEAAPGDSGIPAPTKASEAPSNEESPSRQIARKQPDRFRRSRRIRREMRILLVG